MNKSPIFIHSLYRAGSTYLFKVFRCSDQSYWCYQEPENETLRHLNFDPDTLLLVGREVVEALRHPVLNRSYYWEFYQIKDHLTGLFQKSFSFDDYFVDPAIGLPEEQVRYLKALINHAKGRPVLQFCRSLGRLAAMKSAFGGVHIHLWREPRNQWWSYKVNDYFDSAIQLIYNARFLPPILREVKCLCGIPEFHSADIEEEFKFSREHPLNSYNNYFAFYALWVYGFIAGDRNADVFVNIDRLSYDETYRDLTLEMLSQHGVDGIDFSDCMVPRNVFSDEEVGLFQDIESKVIALFLASGYSSEDIDRVTSAADHGLDPNSGTESDCLRDVVRARGIALRYLDQLAQASERVDNIVNERDQAVVRAGQAVVRAGQAETRAEEAVARADDAETQKQAATAREKKADARACDAVIRANDADIRAIELEKKLILIESSWSWHITKPLRQFNPRYAIARFIRLAKAWLRDRVSGNNRVNSVFNLHMRHQADSRGEDAYHRFSIPGADIFFAKGPLDDRRGIGRVSKELFDQITNIVNIEETRKGEGYSTSGNKKVYFFSSIHWCPDELPTPSVVMIHDVIPLLFPDLFAQETVRQWEDGFRHIAHQADLIVTISQSSADDICRLLGISEKKICVIYNGVSELPVSCTPSVGLPAKPYVVYLGAHDHHKNLEVVLQALRDPLLSELSLAMIGDNKQALPRIVEYGLQDRVFFLGRLADGEVGYVIGNALALVFPSLYEGFGLPPLEAALLGTPSICSRRSAMLETLNDAALFAEPDRPGEWVECLRQLMTEPCLRDNIARIAEERAHQYTWDRTTKTLVEVITKLAVPYESET